MDTQGLILGIDPSYTCTGLVCLDFNFKVVISSTIKVAPGDRRMWRAGSALSMFIKRIDGLNLTLAKAVIEDIAYGAPSRTVVAKLAMLNGVYQYVLDAHSIPWLAISPSTAKRGITGKGTSEKYQVAQELADVYGISFDGDKGFDLSDAAAIAVWGVKQWQKK